MGVIEINAFREWLKKQRSRQDPIGDFARDFLSDAQTVGLPTISSIDHYLWNIRQVEREVLDARDRAWREYAAQKP